MGRSRRAGTLLVAFGLVLGAAFASGCRTGGTGGTGSRGPSKFAPGAHAVTTNGVRVELTTARYRETGVDLRLQIDNREGTPVLVQRQGLVLAYEDLEFPATAVGDTPLPDTTEVPGKGQQTIEVRFDLGGRITAEATLKLRAVQRGQTWLEPIELTIPGGIDPEKRVEP